MSFLNTFNGCDPKNLGLRRSYLMRQLFFMVGDVDCKCCSFYRGVAVGLLTGSFLTAATITAFLIGAGSGG